MNIKSEMVKALCFILIFHVFFSIIFGDIILIGFKRNFIRHTHTQNTQQQQHKQPPDKF